MSSETVMLRCPECRVVRDPSAASCTSCGLIFLSTAHPLRRDEDKQRRVSDALKQECPACLARVDEGALRCRHCGEILDPRYRAVRARRLRAQLNYASWVAYLLGVVTLFIFRPVGIIAIGAGLMLSIAYYAIRIDEPSVDSDDEEEEDGQKANGLSSLKRQFGLETVTLQHPRFPALRTAVMGTPLLIAAIGWAFNYSVVQIPANDAISSVARLADIDVNAHLGWFVDPGTLVLDFDKKSRDIEPDDVRESLIVLSRGLDRDYDRIVVRYRGEDVEIDPATFGALGRASGDDLDLLLEGLPGQLAPPRPVPTNRIVLPLT